MHNKGAIFGVKWELDRKSFETHVIARSGRRSNREQHVAALYSMRLLRASQWHGEKINVKDGNGYRLVGKALQAYKWTAWPAFISGERPVCSIVQSVFVMRNAIFAWQENLIFRYNFVENKLLYIRKSDMCLIDRLKKNTHLSALIILNTLTENW